jgi:RNA polymerase sigma-70 factor (ECF subfamily)
MKALERCMEKLTSVQKQSIDLFYLKEKCYKEIAEITGFTLNDVKSYIQNGKRNLKICLERNSE